MNKSVQNSIEYQNLINKYDSEITDIKSQKELLYNDYNKIKEINKLFHEDILKEKEKRRKLKGIIYEKARKKQKVINIFGLFLFDIFIITAPLTLAFSKDIISLNNILNIIVKVLVIAWSSLEAMFLIPHLIKNITNKKYPIVSLGDLKKLGKKKKNQKIVEEIKKIDEKEQLYKESLKIEKESYDKYKKYNNYQIKLENKKQTIKEIAMNYDKSTYLDKMIGKSNMEAKKKKNMRIKTKNNY